MNNATNKEATERHTKFWKSNPALSTTLVELGTEGRKAAQAEARNNEFWEAESQFWDEQL